MRAFATALALFLTLVLSPALAQNDAASEGSPTTPSADVNQRAPKPDVLYDPGLLPDAVRETRDKILEAALTGDLEKLRAIIKGFPQAPTFTFGEQGDPIEAMKSQSNDGKGLEVMAILAEVLEAGFVHVDAGTPQDMYVWPYFAQYPVDQLTPSQTVELFKIVTSYEFKEMQEFGAYNFYRVGIGPDGVWHFFVSGD